MGPQSCDCGKIAASVQHWGYHRGFNGAAVLRLRKAGLVATAIEFYTATLQWGRSLATAESIAIEIGARRVIGFNGAAVLRLRKGSYAFPPQLLEQRFNGAAVLRLRKEFACDLARFAGESFNGAAVLRLRKGFERLVREKVRIALQWGRSLATAESPPSQVLAR